MTASSGVAKRATLAASKAKWSKDPACSLTSRTAGDFKQDSIRKWLLSGSAENVPLDVTVETAAPLRRRASAEDDLVLGVEASLYGKQASANATQEFIRCLRGNPLSRWNSVTSAFSVQSATLSVMDVLNLWHHDPEELLLDLGFGCEEPDIAVRIPARFINHPSQARGINIQVFLEAQKNRIDVENPEISNRFRQLEVLEEVTKAFSSLVSSAPPAPSEGRPAGSPEAQEKRRRLGQLLRRASKKSLLQARNPAPPSSTELRPETTGAATSDRRVTFRAAGTHEGSCLSPLAEEEDNAPRSQESDLRVRVANDALCLALGTQLRKRSPGDGKAPESFEMEEIQSFDDSSTVGGMAGPVDGADPGFLRANSCQSDSSGFLEEPCVPALSQQGSPLPELMKALYAMSEGSTEGQGAPERGLDPPCPTPHLAPDTEGPSTPPHQGGWECQVTEGTQTNQGVALQPSPELPAGEGVCDEGAMFEGLRYRCHGLLTRTLAEAREGALEAETPAGCSGPTYEGCEKELLVLTQADSSAPQSGDTGEGQQGEAPEAGCPEPARGGRLWRGVPRSVSVQMRSSLPSVSQTVTPKTVQRATSLENWEPNGEGATRSEHSQPRPPDPERAPAVATCLWQDGFRMRSTSLDTGLEDGRWEDGRCCCHCHHRCSCCFPHEHHHAQRHASAPEQAVGHSSTFPYSMDELDGMMRCTRNFRAILVDIEDRLSEEQAGVYAVLSEEDREDIRVIQELRASVRKEAIELELQLSDLAHHYDQSFKTKMHRLLDEQSHLWTQLRLCPAPERQPWDSAPRLRPLPTRSVATQCYLPPWQPVTGGRSTGVHASAVGDVSRETGPSLREKLDLVVFLQRLKDSLRHSVTSDSLK